MMNLTLDSLTNFLCFLNVVVVFFFSGFVPYGMRLNRIGMIRIIGIQYKFKKKITVLKLA